MKTNLLITCPAAGTIIALPAQGLPQLRVSDNGHYLQYTDGTPFFYQGIRRGAVPPIDAREATATCRTVPIRATTLFAVALAECDGVDSDNAYGHKPS